MSNLQAEMFAKDAQIEDLTAKLEEAKKFSEDADSTKTALEEANKALEDAKAAFEKEKRELEDRVAELESKADEAPAFAPQFDMSALYAEAQKNANQVVVEAKKVADKMTREADAKAKKTVEEADAKAKTTVEEADAKAKTTIEEADAQAKTTIEEADAQAKKTVEDATAEAERLLKDAEERSANANAEADTILTTAKTKAEEESVQIKKDAVEQEAKVRELTATVHSMLNIELEGFEKSMEQIAELMQTATKKLEDRISTSKSILSEARQSVEENTKVDEERMEAVMNAAAPAVPVVEAPRPAARRDEKKPGSSDNFANSILDDFDAMAKEDDVLRSMEKDAAAMNKPKKGGAAFFNMSDLIKEAEASVSDDQ